jgi:uncharacterized protein YxeA
MKTNTSLLTAVLLFFSISAFAQIKVLSNGNVGLGAGNTSPGNAVDILGFTVVRPSSSGAYLKIGTGSHGFNMYPSSAHNGDIGYQYSFYSANVDYVYSNGVLLTSDLKFKSNVKSLDAAMPLIKKLRPVSFDYNFDYSKVENDIMRTKLLNDDKNRLGFIAQEVQKILPQSVKVKDSDSTLCLRMDDFIPLLVKGMQEQSVKIDSLKSVIEELKTIQNQLKSATISTGIATNLSENQASLDQNIPNPFSKETRIGCTIPESSTSSVLYIYNMNGTQLQQYNVNGKGKQTVIISGHSLEPGMYLYALVVDGKEVDTKRMILTK